MSAPQQASEPSRQQFPRIQSTFVSDRARVDTEYADQFAGGRRAQVEIDVQVEYESPKIVDYGDFAEVTAGSPHDPIDSGPHGGPHGGPHVDPHLTFSAG
jgi:hypothetical protein